LIITDKLFSETSRKKLLHYLELRFNKTRLNENLLLLNIKKSKQIYFPVNENESEIKNITTHNSECKRVKYNNSNIITR